LRWLDATSGGVGGEIGESLDFLGRLALFSIEPGKWVLLVHRLTL
jgi:hypothetical protein